MPKERLYRATITLSRTSRRSAKKSEHLVLFMASMCTSLRDFAEGLNSFLLFWDDVGFVFLFNETTN